MSAPVKQTSENKIGAGKAGPGRPKGVPNKTTTALKEMILAALNEAHEGGGIEYLKQQAAENPTAFLTLVGKVLPLQLQGDPNNPVVVERVERLFTRPGLPAQDQPSIQ
jgi:hypothetical protein